MTEKIDDNEHLEFKDGFNGKSRFTCYKSSYLIDEWEDGKVIQSWDILRNKEDYFAFLVHLNELAEENQQLKSNEDEFIELNHVQLSKINKLRKKLINEKEKHQEDKFKLQTLEKFYKCPNCGFNGKELKYLKELRKTE